MRLGGVDDAAGEDQVQRAPEPDDPRQPLRAAVDQRDAPAPLGEAELRPGRRDPQVAPQRELEAAGQAPALDRGDRRLRRRQPREPERALGRLQARGERLDRLQVGARAEAHAAGAGDDEHARVVVGLERAERLEQPLGGRPVDGVAPRLAVDRQDGRGARPLVAHLVDLAHGAA